jgi:hypothetical protein
MCSYLNDAFFSFLFRSFLLSCYRTPSILDTPASSSSPARAVHRRRTEKKYTLKIPPHPSVVRDDVLLSLTGRRLVLLPAGNVFSDGHSISIVTHHRPGGPRAWHLRQPSRLSQLSGRWRYVRDVSWSTFFTARFLCFEANVSICRINLIRKACTGSL